MRAKSTKTKPSTFTPLVLNRTPARNNNTSTCKHVLAQLDIRIRNNIFDRPWCFACDPLSKAFVTVPRSLSPRCSIALADA